MDPTAYAAPRLRSGAFDVRFDDSIPSHYFPTKSRNEAFFHRRLQSSPRRAPKAEPTSLARRRSRFGGGEEEGEERSGPLIWVAGEMRLLRVATCNLNQWAMDFDTNLRNVKESIARAKAAGAAIRVGPELELTGYGCEDHFLEQDTTAHAYVTA